MSTDRNGDERLSGKAHDSGAASRPGRATDVDGAFVLEMTAERIGAALRREGEDDSGEQAAITAFRSARAAGDGPLRTRRRDDWRPRTPKQRWARGGAVTLVTSMLLGGIAFASIGVVDAGRHSSPEAGTSRSPRPSAPPTSGEQDSLPAGPSTAPTPSAPTRPGTAKDVEAHCRAYEKIKNRGHALNSTAWQRLVQAAGGEEHVAYYCAQLTAPADRADPTPTKTNKTAKAGKTEKVQGKPSTQAKPSQRPSTRP
ncbi:hypothetical protein [Streptomyces sp. AS02]|uniref:hypothetical protein n=1 Tax=Streptomyces sp. AS02 TaxID=2938946 RepID=UPI0020228041|nr:hypothetical protein [Streptomyces sp. AS02]MCL8017700.1 hypothetical protein [Streptomyces sp. AS02]